MAETPYERPAPTIGGPEKGQTVTGTPSSLNREPEQAYYDAIISCNDKLATTLSLEPLSIATALVARGIIPENTEAETRNPFYTPLQKASILLEAVRSKVKISPRSLHEFIGILSQQPWARDAAEALHASFLSRSTRTTFAGSDDSYNYSSMYTDFLKSLYATLCPTQRSAFDQWPPSAVDKVFRLTMIINEQEQIAMKEKRPLFAEVNIDHISSTKILVELCDILSQPIGKGKRRVVLIEGAPGSGKTTLSIHIGQQWGEGKLFQVYKIVILVIMREPEVKNATSIIDLLPCRNRKMAEKALEEITSTDGQGVLWVLDGWDEVSGFLPQNHIIRKLIQPELSAKSPLYKSDVIVTSRPISTGGIQRYVSHRIEVLGFTPSEQERYFNECLQGDAEAFIDTINKYPAVAGSCYLPLNASIYAHLYRCEVESLPTTQYEIFSSLICNCIYRYCKKHAYQEIDSIRSLNEVPDVLKEYFSKLCELAYTGVMENTFTFSLSSNFNTLGLLRGMESLSRSGVEYTYCFVHMAIQELLAALHMALTMTPTEQESTFHKLFHNPRFNAVLQHFAAITKLKISGLSETIASIVQWYANRRTFEDESFLLALLNCVFEAQDRNLCELICREIGNSIVFGNEGTLTPMDCNSIGYFISQVCVIHNFDFKIRIMNHSIIDEHGWKFLAESFCRFLDPYSYTTAELHLIVTLNGLTVGDIQAIHRAVEEASSNETVQAADHSPIEKESNSTNMIVLHVSNLIKETHAVTVLNLSWLGFTADGCKHLSEAMIENTSVEILYLSVNLIQDEGIETLAPFLEHNTTLKDLYLQGCAITGIGIKYLVKSLKKNTTLQVLDIESNPWLKNQGFPEFFHFLSYCETTALSKIIISPAYLPSLFPAIALLDQIREDAKLHDILWAGDGTLYGSQMENTKEERNTNVREQDEGKVKDMLSLSDSFCTELDMELLQPVPAATSPVGINGRENHKEYLKALYRNFSPISQDSQAFKMMITCGDSEIKPRDLPDIVMKSKIVLIQAIQGSGKTTFSMHICQQWASGALYSDFEFVMLIQLQDPSIQKAIKLADIIPSQSDAAAELLTVEIEAIKGQGMLWIFDGWNDLPPDVQKNSYLQVLITASQGQCGPLARSAIIVTSQPLSAEDSLIDNIHFQLKLNFNSQQMETHILESLARDRIVSDEIVEKVHSASALADIHPTPLTANLLANMFKHCQYLVPATTTYNIFLKMILLCISDELIECNSFEDIPENIKEPLNVICELAYSSLMRGRSTFALPEKFETLGLLQSTKCFTRPQKNTVIHRFMHHTVQHVLAARCIALQTPSDQAMVMKRLFDETRSQLTPVLQYYAAMTKFKPPTIKAAIKELALACLPKSDDKEKSTDKEANKNCLLTLICSLHHAQDPLICQLVASTLKYDLNLSNLHLSLSNLDSVIFFVQSISTRDEFKLSLHSCSLDRRKCEKLLTKLCETLSTTKVDLNLSFQTDLNFTSLFSLINGQIVDSTYFADQMAPSIVRCLKENNFLQSLNISVNGLSTSGARLLSTGLIQNTSLLSLDLNYCSVGDKGVQFISQALQQNQTLLSLSMQGCRITDVGVTHIARALCANRALGHLDISINNKITIEGLSAVAACLCSLENTTLQEIIFPLHLEVEATSACSSINEIREAKNLAKVSLEASDTIGF